SPSSPPPPRPLLRPFPTRRSSDLASAIFSLAAAVVSVSFSLHSSSLSEARGRQVVLFADLTVHRGDRQTHRSIDVDTSDQVSLQDRKSTRLNSSHVTISYAVFCLT